MPYAPEIEELFNLLRESFPDNSDYLITPAMARTGVGGIVDYLGNLATNQVKGSVFRVPYIVVEAGKPTVPTALIPARSRILGMDARATNGTDQGSAQAGVKADPIDFRLLAYASGTIDALVDEQPTTTATVKARWVRTSGTDEEKIASYQELPIEDHNVYRGEVYQYTFENLTPAVTRLVELKQDITTFTHPLPTGEDNDPYYKNFAPLSSAPYDDSELRELIASLATARLAATATVLFANGEASEEFTSHAQAEAAAAPGDLIVLRGFHPQVLVNKPIDIDANLAVIDGLVATYLESGFSYKWRGGYFTKRIFTGRTVGVPHNVVFERITMGPNSYHQSHTNGTNSYGSAADQYTFIDSHLTHVLVNHYNGLSQFQSVFYERCSFVPTTAGAVWRGGFHPQSIVTALNCRFQPQHGDALFDTPAQGRFSLSGISTVGMTAGGINLLSDGLRVVNVADPFDPPASPQQLYPAGDGSTPTPTPASGIDYANPVTLNAAATLSANMAYYATGAGYTLTLPDAAANLGKAIFLSIAATATGLYPISGAGSLALYAAESITFRATLDGWKKTGGELLQLTARIETALTQQDALLAPGYTTIPFSVTKEQNFPGLVDLANSRLLVPRTSRYSLVATATIKDAAVNGQYYFIIRATKADNSFSYLIANYAAIANNGWGTVALSTVARLDAGTTLRMEVYAGGSTGSLLGQYEGNQCTFTLTELI